MNPILIGLLLIIIIIAIWWFSRPKLQPVERFIPVLPPKISTATPITSGCYFLTGANNLRLYTYQNLIQLGPNPGNNYPYGTTKWYYDSNRQVLYAQPDGASTVGFLVPIPNIVGGGGSVEMTATLNGGGGQWVITTNDDGTVNIGLPGIPTYLSNTPINGNATLISQPAPSSATAFTITPASGQACLDQCNTYAQNANASWLQCQDNARDSHEKCDDQCQEEGGDPTCLVACGTLAATLAAECGGQVNVDCNQWCACGSIPA